ncbi:hypothetical protein MFUL124B02_12825 [Myxococcus fulvus 124B02]|nr:hypothetical protein MFUL124B02_12825 [Myxococcus fulvus 124B02]
MPFTADMPVSEHIALLERLGADGPLQARSQVLCLPPAGAQGKSANEATVSGRMTVGEHVFHLRIRLPEDFPRCLPEVTLDSVDPPLDLPHLFGDRKVVCFTSDANLLDRRDPEAILHDSLLLVRDHFARMLGGDRSREFLSEAVVYWYGLARKNPLYCAVTESDRSRVVTALYAAGALHAVADDIVTYAQSLPTRSTEGLSPRNAVYLPLDPGANNASFQIGELTTSEGLRKYVRALPDDERQSLARCVDRCGSGAHLVVLGLKRPGEERALVAILLSNIQGGHPLKEGTGTAKVQPVYLLRRDRAFLAPRGGAGTDLKERSVLIAGCGAVGGYLALSLARAGVGRLSLVDPDIFTPENTYRHVVGMARQGQVKVLGLKEEIEHAIPYVSVAPFHTRIEDLLRQAEPEVRQHDLLILALGYPTIELDVNDWLWSNSAHPPALFTWLEPLGLGGHALLTHARSDTGPTRGCLQCLYERSYEGGPIENRAAFAQPGTLYTRDTLGCGNRFLPFADLDAQRTAELAARMSLRSLRRDVHSSPLRSWKGDRHAFEREGYAVTPRYEKAESGELDYVRPDCPVCAG